jgi:hypothetical protein
MRKLGLAIVSTLCLAPALLAGTGCADHPYTGGDGPAVDPNAPVVHILTPDRGAIAGAVSTVTVTGTATDDVGVTSLTINGVAATVGSDGTFSVAVPVVAGTNLLHAIASDAAGNQGTESRSVVAGPMSPIATQVKNAITASLSAETFDAIGRGAAGYIQGADLEALISPSNPVYEAGEPDGPDCLYGQASITSISVGNTTIGLVPQAGGLALDAEIDSLNIGMHLDYAAACIDGSRDITVSATHVSVTGNAAIGVTAGQFAIAFDDPNVTLTGFDLELGGIPGDVVDLLDLNDALGPIIGWAAEKFVTPMLNTSLSGLNNTKTVSVLGATIDINVAPSNIDFTSDGAIVELDTSLRAEGDASSPGFVNVAQTTPAMDMSQGFQVAVAANAANQMLASLWAAKGLDQTLDLKTGPYGDVGTLYDSVNISALAPPYIDASGQGLKLTVGDLMATFSLGGEAVTKIAINAQVDVKVTSDPTTGAMRLDVGNPTTYVDILDDGVMGANQLSSSQFEALVSFALSRVIAVGSGSVGAIPLPAVGGVMMTDLAIGEQTGYLVVQGDVQ